MARWPGKLLFLHRAHHHRSLAEDSSQDQHQRQFGCSAQDYAGEAADVAVAVVVRGGCSFRQKALAAQRSGARALAVVMADNLNSNVRNDDNDDDGDDHEEDDVDLQFHLRSEVLVQPMLDVW